MASNLVYPNRFYAAVGFAANPPIGSRAVTDETRLLLYALYQQVCVSFRITSSHATTARTNTKRRSNFCMRDTLSLSGTPVEL